MKGMGSLGEVFGRSLRRNFLVLHAALFAVALVGIVLYINGQRQDAIRDIRTTLQQNEDYLLALAVHGNPEGIRSYLAAASDTNPRVKYSWIEESALPLNWNQDLSISAIRIGEKIYGAVRSDLQWSAILNLGVLSMLGMIWMGLFLFSVRVYRNTRTFLQTQVVDPLNQMGETLLAATALNDLLTLKYVHSEVSEINRVREGLVTAAHQFLSLNQTEKNAEIAATLSRVAGQVAHDIRSPLTALEVMSGMLGEVSEEKKQILRTATQRIRDIANNLSEKYRKHGSGGDGQPGENALFLTPLVERLVSEKRWQFRSESGEKHLEFRFGANSLETFARVNRVDFQRVLSNLMNNAIEALDSRGQVVVSVDSLEGKALVQIQDNGRGIPPEILSKLGEVGVTHGKQTLDSGTGLGVHHAIQSARQWGGEIAFRSTLGHGTTVSVLLPLAPKPKWHLGRLSLEATTPLVLVDDDAEMKATWKSELARRAPQWAGAFFYFEDAASFEKEKVKQGGAWDDALFLMDFELRGSPLTGLDLIHRNALGRRAILVTSRFDEVDIQERCQSLGVCLLPKGMISLVAFDVKPQTFLGPKLKLEARNETSAP